MASAQARALAPQSWYAATVISRNDARLAAELEGRLVWVAEIGTRAQTGALLARLDSVLIQETLAEAQAEVARERAQLEYFVAEEQRFKRLVTQNSAAQTNLDEAISNVAVTRSELAAAQARLVQARERLARTELRAPFSGIVTERYRQTGEWAAGGDAVVRLVDTESLAITVRIPSDSLQFIQQGDRLWLRAGEQRKQGELRTIVPVGDDRSRLYELRIIPPDDDWPAGQTLRVAVPAGKARQVIAVPRDALVLRSSGIAVFRVRDNTAERIPVTTGLASGELIEAIGDIAAGDQIVIRGGERLRPGQPVTILDDVPQQ